MTSRAEPICTRIAEVRSSPKSPAWLRPRGWNCATCISPSPAWKIFFCTTPEGVCGNELEDFFCHAGARRSRRPPQLYGFDVSDILAASDVRVHLRPRDGSQRVHAGVL